MGWDFGWHSKQELLDELNRSWENNGTKVTHLKAHTVDKGHGEYEHYTLVDVEQPGEPKRTMCEITLIEHRPDSNPRVGAWGCKRMDETVGPYAVAAPLAWLDALTAPEAFSAKWRERVREYHRNRRAKETA